MSYEFGDQGQLDVEVSLDAGLPVMTDNDVDGPLEISLPTEVAVADGEVASDGTVVHAADRGDVHAAVQVLDDGVRLRTVLEGSEAPSTYSYEFATGVEPILLDDGSIELVEQFDEGISVVTGTRDSRCR
ncbi:hypothetical protein [Demequina sediminicola]|uniref:hypothetical protein n=1 Tax=Demequina sediminicola TaxID=1095026 RepID=UPI000783E5C4|nr:hypothetical protein [Demequina sediminicola]